MRLLKRRQDGTLCRTKNITVDIPPYAILSHTWIEDEENEVQFNDLETPASRSKVGYRKIEFCTNQAALDGLQHSWVDTCCIDQFNSVELSEAINSMFRWYRNAAKCYVFLSDVSAPRTEQFGEPSKEIWISAFRVSRWFTRGWTLQELIAPASVEFFSCEGAWLGDKKSLEQEIHAITDVPIGALRGAPLSEYTVSERISWIARRNTKRDEDMAYSLMGIFGVYMAPIYGEGRENARIRLLEEVDKRANSEFISGLEMALVSRSSYCQSTRLTNKWCSHRWPA
jgi:hypothetical protein